MGKSKIRFLIESLNVGGAEKALISLLKLLDYNCFDITLTLISESGEFIKELETIKGLNWNSYVKPSNSKKCQFVNSLKVKAIYKWLTPKRVGNYFCSGYDVVVAFCEGYLTKWIGSATVPCKKIAWVHTDMVHNDWPVKTGVFRDYEEETKVYHNFDEVVAVSNLVARGLTEKFGLNKLTTIYNILDSNIIKKSKESTGYTPKKHLNLVSVGRLEFVKGFHNLIEAMNILINERKCDISLCIVGNGSQMQTLEHLVGNYNLQEYVFFAGAQTNPYPFIAKSDVYVCSSLHEGFNIAILEAMTLGKPIIATDSAGPREILDSGKYGLLATNDVAGLVMSIYDIYLHPSQGIYFSKCSLERSSHFKGATQMDTIIKLLSCDA